MFPTKKSPKNLQKFLCEMCDYTCFKISEYRKHVSTNKHKILQNPTLNPTIKSQTFINSETNSIKTYNCECGKIYKHSSTLYAHKKKVHTIDKTNPILQTDTNLSTDTVLPTDKELIMLLLKENNELKNAMLNVIKNGTHNNNSHNKTFNLQVFLNEQCKDALNIGEFVEQIKIQLSDLETTGRLGYVEGVTRIINKNLNELETNKRPIHCSDIKRETIYIKDENEWIKENNDKTILKHAVKEIANKNILQINEWKKANPDCMDSDSRKNDLYLKIVSNSMSGSTKEEQFNNLNKIISKVTKEVVIDKV